ncbi:hypothetical protein BDN70DRAFT_959220 [Pholiota conissans]|uniref:Uncharacterized protein n=1 Tax=Pholiota conissans TaxID=109636 RepID=A0A9P5YTJ2_9AGAR|nr:hypothetical protein BDN70DRAFT_959220 [Pholiota conissans]
MPAGITKSNRSLNSIVAVDLHRRLFLTAKLLQSRNLGGHSTRNTLAQALRTLDRPSLNAMDSFTFTVHEFSNTVDQATQTAILSGTYHLLRDVVHGFPKRRIIASKPIQKIESNHTFIFAPEVPNIESSYRENALKEWGEPAAEDEIFQLHELEDFCGTSFLYLLNGKPSWDAIQSRTLIEPENKNTESLERLSKKRRLNITQLYYLIPQPHIHSSPFLATEPPFSDVAFSVSEPLFMDPYINLSVSNDARVAWLIPIRGVLPWSECSSGTLLDEDSDFFDSTSQISWTTTTLLEFWEFLVGLRSAGAVGALGVSFHAAQNKQRARAVSANPKRPGPLLPASIPALNSNPSSAGSRPTLVTMDYIKVYHDVRRRLHLRRILDEWTPALRTGREHLKHPQVLKHARLVLLDEVSQAILIL